jgi:putative peptidoglycan lipid II flippase
MKRQFLQVAALSAAGYVLAFGNQLLLSYYFGTSAELDAYWVSMSAIQLAIFFVGPVREGLVPQFHRRWKASTSDANTYFSGVFNALVILLAISAVVVLIFRGYLAGMLVSGKQAQLAGQVSAILIYMLPMVFLLALTEVGNSMLASLDKVVFQNMGRMIGALLFGACILLLGNTFGVVAIVIAAIAGQIGFTLFQARALGAAGLHYSPAVRPKVDRALTAMAGVLMVSYAISQGYIVFERNVLTYFGEGVVSAYQYAQGLSQVPQMIFIASLSMVVWPKMLDAIHENNKSAIGHTVAEATKILFMLLSAIALFGILFAQQIIYVLFFRGKFDLQSLTTTATCLKYTLLALVPLGYTLLAGRAFVTMQSRKGLVSVGIGTALIGTAVLLIGRTLESLEIALLHLAAAGLAGAMLSVFWLGRILGMRMTRVITPAAWWWGIRLIAVLGLMAAVYPVPAFVMEGTFLSLAKLGAHFVVFALCFAALLLASGVLGGTWRERREVLVAGISAAAERLRR